MLTPHALGEFPLYLLNTRKPRFFLTVQEFFLGKNVFGSWSGSAGVLGCRGGIDYVTLSSYGISQLAVHVVSRRILCHIPQLWNFTALALCSDRGPIFHPDSAGVCDKCLDGVFFAGPIAAWSSDYASRYQPNG
jgi:hypothetical protein